MQLAMKVTGLENCPIPPHDGIICAVGRDLHWDICHGDSGGPLACQGRPNLRRWYLVGVASSRSQKCDSGAAFSMVPSYEKWIMNVTSRK